MTMTGADYVYNRKDGGQTYCYGSIEDDSNFEVVCEDEYNDGIWAGEVGFEPKTWPQVCEYLEKYYDAKIEQLEAC